jgi:Tfp pilus assembly protein PilV
MKKIGTSNGVTLIETLFTILIIGIGLIGVLYIFGGTVSKSLVADQTVQATNLAHEKLEEIISDRANLGYDNVETKLINGNYSDGTLPSPYNIYTRTVTYNYINVPSAPDGNDNDDFATTSIIDTGYIRVIVNISWNNGGDYINIATLLSNWAP